MCKCDCDQRMRHAPNWTFFLEVWETRDSTGCRGLIFIRPLCFISLVDNRTEAAPHLQKRDIHVKTRRDPIGKYDLSDPLRFCIWCCVFLKGPSRSVAPSYSQISPFV